MFEISTYSVVRWKKNRVRVGIPCHEVRTDPVSLDSRFEVIISGLPFSEANQLCKQKE